MAEETPIIVVTDGKIPPLKVGDRVRLVVAGMAGSRVSVVPSGRGIYSLGFATSIAAVGGEVTVGMLSTEFEFEATEPGSFSVTTSVGNPGAATAGQTTEHKIEVK